MARLSDVLRRGAPTPTGHYIKRNNVITPVPPMTTPTGGFPERPRPTPATPRPPTPTVGMPRRITPTVGPGHMMLFSGGMQTPVPPMTTPTGGFPERPRPTPATPRPPTPTLPRLQNIQEEVRLLRIARRNLVLFHGSIVKWNRLISNKNNRLKTIDYYWTGKDTNQEKVMGEYGNRLIETTQNMKGLMDNIHSLYKLPLQPQERDVLIRFSQAVDGYYNLMFKLFKYIMAIRRGITQTNNQLLRNPQLINGVFYLQKSITGITPKITNISESFARILYKILRVEITRLERRRAA
ncbi:MAG: hypothetical protein ABIJ08_07120 [Nanoarchaeota archaeon]